MNNFFIFGGFSAVLSLAAAEAASSASSRFYSLSVDEFNQDSRSGKLLPKLASALPKDALIQRVMPTEVVDNMLYGIFVQYTLGGSATCAPTIEILGILEGHPSSRLSCRELISGKADDLECDEFFLDSASQRIQCVVKYVKAGTEQGMTICEMGIALSDGSVSCKAIVDTTGTKNCIRNIDQCGGKVASYEILRSDAIYFYVREADGGFSEVTRFLATDPYLTLALPCNNTKHFYERHDRTDGTTQLRWLNPDTRLFEETNFNEFCSLVSLSENDYGIFIVDPQNPKDILGQLFWDKGVIRPKWRSRAAQEFFDKAEAAIRAKLKEDSCLFSDAQFDYQTLQVSLIESVRTIYGTLQVVGCDSTVASFAYGTGGVLILNVTETHPLESVVSYNHELIQTKSKIRGDADIDVHYSIFRPKPGGADVETRKTVVYIPGGPWSHFNTHDFLSQYKSFLAEGYTIIVPHEPLRQGFGYNYSFAQKQLGRRNLHHIMNILDDACGREGVNPEMVLMGESYGGWVACALAAKWQDFVPERSPLRLQACIAQAADLNFKKWQENVEKSGHKKILTTFADDPVDVTSITELQVPLLICHGLGDVRCPIDSIQVWAEGLRRAEQPFAFMKVLQGHAGILTSSSMYETQEYEIRLNIVRRLFEGNGLPGASAEGLDKYGIEVWHDNLCLFERAPKYPLRR
jgi:pimeloyl-ACP methyl ester carboxylesterase